jgi:NAD(P)-dependent dehydrogenase (short-subunit alcohol dehydrogenase family)
MAVTIDLSGRVAVVTGAGTGLGAAIARRLAAAGADLLLHYRSHGDWLESVVRDGQLLGRRVEVSQADFAVDAGAAAQLVDSAIERLGRIDILVNNAAVTTKVEPFEDHSRELLDEVLQVNVVAPFLATQAAARWMVAAGTGGRIVNIGSVHGQQSAPAHTAYEISKAGIDALSWSVAVALGRYGITVNCVAPGAIRVERYDDVDWDEDWFVGRTPVGRMGQPADIAAAVCFLCSDEAAFITGEVIYVVGGMRRRLPIVK